MKNKAIFEAAVAFVDSHINRVTGLVSSQEGSVDGNVLDNALGLQFLIHEGKQRRAGFLLTQFQLYFLMHQEEFAGFPDSWNTRTGVPNSGAPSWEADSAMLLQALNYYERQFADSHTYSRLRQGLIEWLVERARNCEYVLAEGVAVLYAALSALPGGHCPAGVLLRLRDCFFSTGQLASRDYAHQLSHIALGVLVFNDPSGFQQLTEFACSQVWRYDKKTRVHAYRAVAGESYIDVEASALLGLAASLQPELCRTEAAKALTRELDKLWLPACHKARAVGLPAYVSHKNARGSYDRPSLRPTCYRLFQHWKWNPFRPFGATV